MRVKRCRTLIGGLLTLVGSLMVTAPIVSANEDIMKLQKDDGQWVVQSKNYAGTRYSTLNQITPENVKNLKVAWSFSLGTLNGQQGGPLVVGDTMYAHSSYSTGNSHNIFALDLSKEARRSSGSTRPSTIRRRFRLPAVTWSIRACSMRTARSSTKHSTEW